MDGDVDSTQVRVRFCDVLPPARWAVWRQRPRLLAYIALVELLVLASTVRSWLGDPIATRDYVVFAALAAMGVLQAELGRQVERLRRLMSDTPHVNLTSVWTFAGVLLLPPVLVSVLVVVLYAHLATRSLYRMRRVPPFRTIFNSALVVISCHATAAILPMLGIPSMYAALGRGWQGVGVLTLAVLIYFVVESLIVIPGLTVESWSLKAVLGGWGDNLLEVATLCLGILLALALGTLPGLAALVLPPLIVLHRAVLVRQLEIAATTDEKTGLFNTKGWHNLAARELARAQRSADSSFGVLMVDLDHFKVINDTHGHLVGDAVLREVAAAITGAVRDYDSVGRFGGEEFLVLLPDIYERDLRVVAERVHNAIAAVSVDVSTDPKVTMFVSPSASIGMATYPDAGAAIDRLIHAADRALYNAKNTGRNKVVSFVDVA